MIVLLIKILFQNQYTIAFMQISSTYCMIIVNEQLRCVYSPTTLMLIDDKASTCEITFSAHPNTTEISDCSEDTTIKVEFTIPLDSVHLK